MRCDMTFLSSTFLAERASQFHSNVHVMRNALNRDFFDAATAVSQKKKGMRKNTVVVAYLSGSSSHDADFRIAEPHLFRLLEERDNVRLLVVGHLESSDRLCGFGARFDRREFIPYSEYVSLFEEIDVNLIPLEKDEAFCHGKVS